MTSFPAADTAITHILIATDIERSKTWYLDVLGASLYREYGGTSVVLSFAGAWLLLTTGGPPTNNQPASPSPPGEPGAASTTCSRSGSMTAPRCTRPSAGGARRSSRRP